MDLDAVPPPRQPRGSEERNRATFSVRPPSTLAAWVRDRVYRDHTSVNQYLIRLIERDRAEPRWPADVQEWLLVQAAQCGMPGDPDGAVVAVVRHLARRWPDGGRLNDDDGSTPGA